MHAAQRFPSHFAASSTIKFFSAFVSGYMSTYSNWSFSLKKFDFSECPAYKVAWYVAVHDILQILPGVHKWRADSQMSRYSSTINTPPPLPTKGQEYHFQQEIDWVQNNINRATNVFDDVSNECSGPFHLGSLFGWRSANVKTLEWNKHIKKQKSQTCFLC